MPDDEPRKWVTNEQLQLEIKAMRSDFKLWILGAVALNQFLASVALPAEFTGVAILGFLGKAVVGFIGSRT